MTEDTKITWLKRLLIAYNLTDRIKMVVSLGILRPE